ncbi:MAG: AAA family ATPase [Chitinispirillia bacterium]|nr:AAA family ATPase [Chitinispirillia bacterium]
MNSSVTLSANTTTSNIAAPPEAQPTCRLHPGVALTVEVYGFGAHSYTQRRCPICRAAADRAEEERRQAEKRRQLLRGIPHHYHGADLAALEPDKFQLKKITADGESVYVRGGWPLLKRWIIAPRGFCYLYGDCGTGKTYVACAAMKRFNSEGKPAEITFANETFLRLRHSYEKNAPQGEAEILNRIAPEDGRPHIAIIDDLGVQLKSKHVVETWTLLIDRLARNNTPALITTNLSPAEIGDLLGDRVASRLASGPVIKLTGPDRRMRAKDPAEAGEQWWQKL